MHCALCAGVVYFVLPVDRESQRTRRLLETLVSYRFLFPHLDLDRSPVF